jgi:thioredoxin 1
MAARVGKDDFEAKVLKAALPVLVDFYSDSCVPCKRMSPVIADVSDDNEGRLDVYKLNVGFDTDVAMEYDVTAVPTLILFKDGKELARQTGAMRKDDLVAWLDGALK